MTTRFLLSALGASIMGSLGLATDVPAATMFACPFVECVSFCPEDRLDWCHTHGCDTTLENSNCGPLFQCSGNQVLVYCGSSPDQ